MTCTVCGTLLPAGASKCPRCGTPVPAPLPSRGIDPTVYAPGQQGAQAAPPASGWQGAPYEPTVAAPQPQNAGAPYEPTVAAPQPQNARYSVPPQYPQQGYQQYPQQGYPQQYPQQPQYRQSVPPLPQSSLPPLPSSYGRAGGSSTGKSGSGKRAAIIIGIVALALILLAGSIPFLLSNNAQKGQSTQNSNTNTSTKQSGQTAAATPTPVPTQPLRQVPNPYVSGRGTLVLDDPMRDNSRGYQWDQGTFNGKKSGEQLTCSFAGGQYHVSRNIEGAHLCRPEASSLTFNNLTYEAHLTLKQGDFAGLAVRIDPARGTGYLFLVGSNGGYAIGLVDLKANTQKEAIRVLRQGVSFLIKPGLNQENTVGVVANGRQLRLFINGQELDSVNDSSLSNAGQVGIFVNSNQGRADVAASGVRVWKL
jgi:hypothetical protein